MSTSGAASSRGPLHAVLTAVYDDLLQELILDRCIQEHKEAHLRSWPRGTLTPATPTDVDVFGFQLTKKVPERSFKCESCGQKSGSSKYAAHLEKCTGKGGRASSRRNKPVTTGAAASSQAQASLAALNTQSWEDDAEIIAASGPPSNGRQMQSHARHGLPTSSVSPAVPSPSGHFRNSPHVALPVGVPNHNSLSSPYTIDASPEDSVSPNGTSYNQEQSWPAGTAQSTIGQKRKPLDLSDVESKKRRPTLKAEDFWTTPLTSSLPTNVIDGGLPYMVVGSECHLGTAPSADQLSEMLSRICGVPSHSTWKMCSNKPACSMHSAEDKQTTRQGIRDGLVFVRFKRVAPTSKSKKAAPPPTYAPMQHHHQPPPIQSTMPMYD